MADPTPGLGGLDGADAGGAVAVRPAARGPPADPGRRGLPAPAGRQAGPGGDRSVEHPRPGPGPPRLPPGQPVRIGLPLDGGRLAVADLASGQPVPWGEVGELVIGGVGVARYLDQGRDAVDFRPLTALGPERAYRTGDLVRADQEGLIYLGRADAQVKIRGYRVELSEIEA